ncbi:MAG: hypothetical protein ACP5SH_06845 [Syntrophobacteraceae bacterium]
MNRGLRKTLWYAGVAFLGLTLCAGMGTTAKAADSNPLQFWTGPDGSYIKAQISGTYAVFDNSNSWFGQSNAMFGLHEKFYEEGQVKPAIVFNYGCLPNGQSIYGSVGMAITSTFGGVDGGGTNVTYVGGIPLSNNYTDTMLQESYIGWKSGNDFDAWGLQKNFLDISFGRQQYNVSNGFLIWDEGRGGHEEAGYWMGGRNDADYAGIVRFRQGPLALDLVYLRPNIFTVDGNTNQINGHIDANMTGFTLDYDFPGKIAHFGGGIYANDVTSSTTNPTGGAVHGVGSLNAYDIRGWVKPFTCSNICLLQPFRFEGEFVHEQKYHADDPDANAYYLQASYPFQSVPWSPELVYRYSFYGNHYDTMYQGFTDWEYWFQGEIMDEYPNVNQNEVMQMIELKFSPIKPLNCKIAYIHYNVENPEHYGMSHEALADELDLITDWTVNDHLAFSVVGAMANPGGGMLDYLNYMDAQVPGGNGIPAGTDLHTWYYVMFLTSVSF